MPTSPVRTVKPLRGEDAVLEPGQDLAGMRHHVHEPRIGAGAERTVLKIEETSYTWLSTHIRQRRSRRFQTAFEPAATIG